MNKQINTQQRVIRKRNKIDIKSKHIGYSIGIAGMIIVLALMATFVLAKITQYRMEPNEVLEASCDGRGFSIEPLSRTEVQLKCIENPSSPTPPPTEVPPTGVPPTGVPPTGVPPTAVPPTSVPPTVNPDNPLITQVCEDIPINLVKNAGFNNGTNNWQFYSDGNGQFTIDGSGYCANAARLDMVTQGNNVQLYQQNVQLEPNTKYIFGFIAKSNSGHDLTVNLHKHVANYDNYGLKDFHIDVGTEWQAYYGEFVTPAKNGAINDGRLRFWFAPFDANGDIYWIDQVIIIRADLLNLPSLPPVIALPPLPGTQPTSEPTAVPPTSEPTGEPPTIEPTSVPPTGEPTIAPPTSTPVPPTATSQPPTITPVPPITATPGGYPGPGDPYP